MSNGSEEAVQSGPAVSLENPFVSAVAEQAEVGRYEATLKRGAELREKPYVAAGPANRQRQHLKGRMTVWERIEPKPERTRCARPMLRLSRC